MESGSRHRHPPPIGSTSLPSHATAFPRPFRRILAALLAASVLVLAGAFAEIPPAGDRAAPGALNDAGSPAHSPSGPRDLLPKQVPIAAGWILLVAAVPPLVWGWKIIRLTMAAFFGLAFALVAFELVARRSGQGWAAAAALAAAVGGVALGWHVRKFFAAVEGACVIGFLFALPGLLLNVEFLTFGLAAAGIVLGIVLGWKAAFYLDAIDSSLVGGFMAGLGARIVARDLGNDRALIVGVAVLAVSALAGIAVQFRSVRRAQRQGRT